jgi:hypothetical protein
MAAPITYPFDCWMGLQVAGAEVSGVGYVRRSAHFEDIGDGVTAANVASVQWPPCGSDWGAIDTVNLYGALTGGNLLCTGVTISVVRGSLYDVLRVSAGGYQVINTTFGLLATSGGNIGTPYDAGPYGDGPYEMEPPSVLLFRTFGSVALCGNQPGVWAPGPFDVVAA